MCVCVLMVRWKKRSCVNVCVSSGECKSVIICPEPSYTPCGAQWIRTITTSHELKCTIIHRQSGDRGSIYSRGRIYFCWSLLALGVLCLRSRDMFRRRIPIVHTRAYRSASVVHQTRHTTHTLGTPPLLYLAYCWPSYSIPFTHTMFVCVCCDLGVPKTTKSVAHNHRHSVHYS